MHRHARAGGPHFLIPIPQADAYVAFRQNYCNYDCCTYQEPRFNPSPRKLLNSPQFDLEIDEINGTNARP